MRIDILTLFPQMFDSILNESIIKRAQERGIVSFNTVNFRDFSTNKHKTVDDYPYGGGEGMVLTPEPIFLAVESILTEQSKIKSRIILLTPQGKTYNQKIAKELANEEHLILINGHYEGFDERIREHLVTDEISIGDFVLTGGEIATMVLIDSIVRLIPGVLGNLLSSESDSFSNGLLEYPQYTRPYNFRGWKVPDILLSGNHQQISEWRMKESLKRTYKKRPDLIKEELLSDQQKKMLQEIINDN